MKTLHNHSVKYFLRAEAGFTLIEVVITIVIVATLAGMAVRYAGGWSDEAKQRATEAELNSLASAIVGDAVGSDNPTSFGYVGDVGSLPPNLAALVNAPIGYTTWKGPYISANFDGSEYTIDAWNTPFVLSGVTLSSVGSGVTITKALASTNADLFGNTVRGVVLDAYGRPPGSVYKDSVVVTLQYPNGSGGTATASATPTASGNFSFTNVPIGMHTLAVRHLPSADTLSRQIVTLPRSTQSEQMAFGVALW